MKSPLNFCPRRRWNLSASLPRLGTTSLWYFERNYDAGVPPASFFEDGSQGPPCDPNLSQPLGKHRSFTSREASAAGRLRSSRLVRNGLRTCINNKCVSNSFVFENKIEKEGLPRDSPAGLGAGGRRFKSGRPDQNSSLVFFSLLKTLFTQATPK